MRIFHFFSFFMVGGRTACLHKDCIRGEQTSSHWKAALVNLLLWEHGHAYVALHLHSRAEWLWQRSYGLHSLRYLLTGPSQKTTAEPRPYPTPSSSCALSVLSSVYPLPFIRHSLSSCQAINGTLSVSLWDAWLTASREEPQRPTFSLSWSFSTCCWRSLGPARFDHVLPLL